MADLTPEYLRNVITAAFPELAGAQIRLHTAGWDSVAVDVDDRLIFKFPRHEIAEAALKREASLLAVIRPAVTMRVPDLSLHDGPPLFSRHEKLPGEHLVTDQYAALSEAAKQRLAADMAQFYAELHQLNRGTMAAAGAKHVHGWSDPEAVLRRTWPVLPTDGLRRYAEKSVAAWAALPPDPYGETYGYFDGHGWNMAFDHAAQRLNGLYDFADSGIGPVHREFVYSNWISRDLTARIITEYEQLTGRRLDRERIELLSGILRLWELAEYADDSTHRPSMLKIVMDWAASAAM